MSVLLDRLCGFDLDEEAGKTKLPVQQFVDAIRMSIQYRDAVPNLDLVWEEFGIKVNLDPESQKQQDDASFIVGLISSAQIDHHDVIAILRLAEMFPKTYNKDVVLGILKDLGANTGNVKK